MKLATMLQSRFLIALIAITLGISCKKSPLPIVHPPLPTGKMDTVNLGNKIVQAQNAAVVIDLNKDGRKDLIFGTMLVGDPLLMQDKMLMIVTSDIETNLLVNQMEEVPVLSKGNTVPLGDIEGHHWFNASSVTLVRKITGVTVPVFWEGNWKTAIAKYLPVQVLKNNQKFNGWVQLTVDIAHEQIVLHQAVISKIADKAIVIL